MLDSNTEENTNLVAPDDGFHLTVKCRQMYDAKRECFKVKPAATNCPHLLVCVPSMKENPNAHAERKHQRI